MKIPEVLLSEEAILDIEYLADLFLKKHGASAALSFIDQFVCRCHIMVDESKIHTLSLILVKIFAMRILLSMVIYINIACGSSSAR